MDFTILQQLSTHILHLLNFSPCSSKSHKKGLHSLSFGVSIYTTVRQLCPQRARTLLFYALTTDLHHLKRLHIILKYIINNIPYRIGLRRSTNNYKNRKK
jgi:hypothetical protein